MEDDFRELQLASYADRAEAMAIQTLLEAHGIHSRIEDLAGLPTHALGLAAGLNRSVAIWVLAVDAERAATLLATLGAPENAVDEEALAAEAEASAMSEPSDGEAADTEPPGPDREEPPPPIHPTGSAVRVVLAILAAVATLLILRSVLE